MFIPRALQLKGVHEPTPKKLLNSESVAASPPAIRASPDSTTNGICKIRNGSPIIKTQSKDGEVSCSDPKNIGRTTITENQARIMAGIELIFSDYAHREESRLKWLQEHYRTLDGDNKFVHLSSIFEHPYICNLKPKPTQPSIQQALQALPSDILELSHNGYHVRRKPSTYPPRFLPLNSFSTVDDDGLTFWDQRTIYIEPHIRNLCQQPARVAYWLKEHGQLKPKWLPIQAVHTMWNSCALVVLSGNVMHKDVWEKWRKLDKPENWKIMTKVEHTKRTAEYVALLQRENPNGMRKVKAGETELPSIARPAALPLNFEIKIGDVCEAVNKQANSKRKRKKSKRKRRDDRAAGSDVNMDKEEQNDSEYEDDASVIKRVA